MKSNRVTFEQRIDNMLYRQYADGTTTRTRLFLRWRDNSRQWVEGFVEYITPNDLLAALTSPQKEG